MKAINFIALHRDSNFVQNWMEIEKGITGKDVDLNTVLQNQTSPKMYASELFIRATAIVLNIAIVVTTSESSAICPYRVFWPWGETPIGLSINGFLGHA